jgi:hypothetical protein
LEEAVDLSSDRLLIIIIITIIIIIIIIQISAGVCTHTHFLTEMGPSECEMGHVSNLNNTTRFYCLKADFYKNICVFGAKVSQHGNSPVKVTAYESSVAKSTVVFRTVIQ